MSHQPEGELQKSMSARSNPTLKSSKSSTITIKKGSTSHKRSNSQHLFKLSLDPQNPIDQDQLSIKKELFKPKPDNFSNVASNSFIEIKDTNLYSKDKDLISYLTYPSGVNLKEGGIASNPSLKPKIDCSVTNYSSLRIHKRLIARRSSEKRLEELKKGGLTWEMNSKNFFGEKRKFSKNNWDQIEKLRHLLKLEELKVRNYVDLTISLQKKNDDLEVKLLNLLGKVKHLEDSLLETERSSQDSELLKKFKKLQEQHKKLKERVNYMPQIELVQKKNHQYEKCLRKSMAVIVDVYEISSILKQNEDKEIETHFEANHKITDKILSYFNESSVLLSKFGFENLIKNMLQKFHDSTNKKRPSRYSKPPKSSIKKTHKKSKSDTLFRVGKNYFGSDFSFGTTQKRKKFSFCGPEKNFGLTKKISNFSKRVYSNFRTVEKEKLGKDWEMDNTIYKGINVTFWD